MAKPDAPQDREPQDDTTFAATTDDATATATDSTIADTHQLEQTVQSETTEQRDRTEATRAIGVEDEPARDLFGNPVGLRDDVHDAATPATTRNSGTTGPAATGDGGWPPVLPERPTGPHAPAIVLGLVCLAVAGIILAQELGSLTVDWGDIGPVGIVLTGAVLVLFGLVGLLSSRRGSRTG